MTQKCTSQVFYHPKFAKYVERISSADINATSYHSIAFEVINPLLHIYFPGLERKTFFKYLKSTLPSSVTLLCRNFTMTIQYNRA